MRNVIDCRPFFARLRARREEAATPRPSPVRTYVVALVEDLTVSQLTRELSGTRLRLRNHRETGELVLFVDPSAHTEK